MVPKMTAADVIAALNLAPLEGEGGYFRQTWIAPRDSEDRPVGTSILYLVTPASFSALRKKSPVCAASEPKYTLAPLTPQRPKTPPSSSALSTLTAASSPA